MPRTHPVRPTLALVASVGAALALGAGPPPTAAIHPPPTGDRLPAPSRPGPRGASPDPGGGSAGWWVGTAGIAAALAAFGGAAAASRRFLPAREGPGPLRVVGRASLSARQSVYLLRAGDRVLIVGAGAQGPPSLLGELTDPDEIERIAPRRRPAAGPSSPRTAPAPVLLSRGFDQRIGDDE